MYTRGKREDITWGLLSFLPYLFLVHRGHAVQAKVKLNILWLMSVEGQPGSSAHLQTVITHVKDYRSAVIMNMSSSFS